MLILRKIGAIQSFVWNAWDFLPLAGVTTEQRTTLIQAAMIFRSLKIVVNLMTIIVIANVKPLLSDVAYLLYMPAYLHTCQLPLYSTKLQ